MKYSIKSLDQELDDAQMRMISDANKFARANLRNSGSAYDHEAVIEFLSEESSDFDNIVRSLIK